MSNPATTKTESPPQPKSEVLQPVLDISQDDPEYLPQYATILAKLTTNERRILVALVENMSAEDKRTETAIALDLGVDRSTIHRARQKAAFQQALGAIVRDNLKGLHDRIVGGIYKHGVKDWNAYKFLLQYDGSYVQSQRNLNLNASISQDSDRPSSPQQATESYCTRFMSIGYDKQSLLNLVGDTYDRLKDEGL